MAGGLVIADRIKETAAAPGTGNVTLGGAVTGFQTFAGGGCTNNSKIYYGISDGSTKWEVGLGTWVTGPTLQRTTVLASSNSGSAENFTLAITIWGDRPAVMDLLPTQQVLTSGSGATYATPANCRQLRIRMVAGGGGGAAGNGGGAATAGGATSFNSIVATGGGAGADSSLAGQGGNSGTGSASFRGAGQSGASGGAVLTGSGIAFNGAMGGASLLGGGASLSGTNSKANTGAGGYGGNGSGYAGTTGGGGGGGEYVEIIINDPAATYTYTVGAGGAGGTAGSGTAAGSNGGSGVIIVDEIYGS